MGLTQSDGLRWAGNAKLGEMEKSDSTNFGSRLGHASAGSCISPLGSRLSTVRSLLATLRTIL